MSGSGIRVFASGEILTAAQVNGYLMDQAVTRFADAATRDASFGGAGQPVLSEGRICYLDDVNLIQFFDGTSWQSSAQFTVSDGTITTAKLADDAVTGAKIADNAITAAHIADGTIIAADIADGSVTSAKILDGTIVNADINASAAIALSKLATGALPTAITVASANIVDGTIVNADINASAAIALSKLASGTSGQIVVHSSGGVPTATTISGDITIDSTGNVQIAADKIINADIKTDAAIEKTKISGTAITAADSGTVTSTMIADGTIVNADVNASAAIAYSKLNLGTSIVNADVSTSAAIAYSKLNLGTSIVNADVSTSAAIVDTKLATISTAGKVSNSATTATNANTASAIVARDASGDFIAGKATLATADINTVIETASIVASASTGTINIDFSTNPTVYYTVSATNDWTINVRGTSGVTLNNTLSTGQIATVTFLATIGATQKRPTVFQVDGSSVTPKWMGGTAPTTGNASSIDAYTLAIIKTGSAAFTVLASQTKFA